MSELLFPIAVNVVLGIGLLGLFIWRRPAGQAQLTADEALGLFRRQYPDASGTVTVAADSRTALIELQPGIGLLQRQGRRWVSRALERNQIASVRQRADGAIQIAFADFGWPRALVRLEDPQLRASWLQQFERLAAPLAGAAGADRHHA